MTTQRRRFFVTLAVSALVSGAVAPLCAEQDKPADAAPAASADAAPATQPSITMSDDVRQLVDQVAGAYRQLSSLDLAGTITAEFQIDGSEPERHSAEFTSSFQAPNRFRHQIKGDVLVGSTGQQLYIYKDEDNAYSTAEVAKDKLAARDLPKDTSNILQLQNPSLLLAISKDPAAQIESGATRADSVDAVKVGDVSCPSIKLVQDDHTTVTLSTDPQTHLLRQVQFDMTAALKQRRPDLARAVVTVAYARMAPGADEKDELFAWAPPPGASNAAAAAAAHPLEAVEASALEGKAAPDFKIEGMDGQPVALGKLKGHVLVIDFWATWCGPCRASLPHLNKLYDEKKKDGVRFFALDLKEDKADVEAFIKETKLTVPVLLDSDGRVAEAYGVEGIPQTVVIGKDGKVRKVFVGFDPSASPAELKKAVDAALSH